MTWATYLFVHHIMVVKNNTKQMAQVFLSHMLVLVLFLSLPESSIFLMFYVFPLLKPTLYLYHNFVLRTKCQLSSFLTIFLWRINSRGRLSSKSHMIDPCTSFYHLQFQINMLASTFDFHQILGINILDIPILGSLISFCLRLGCQHLLLKHHLVIIVNAIKVIVDPLFFFL